MLEPSQSSKLKTLQFSTAEIISGLGILCFMISLALPAIKHGSDMLGINCFLIALLGAVTYSPFSFLNERQMMCIASHAMHLTGLIAVVLTWNRVAGFSAVKYACVSITVLCVPYVATTRYSCIETVYFGFYLWLASLLLINAAPFVMMLQSEST